jgi:hypothetical protein
MDPYDALLHSKIKVAERYGVEVDRSRFHPSGFPHQLDMTEWMMRQGRGLLAARFGLGKTQVQLEAGRLAHEETDQRVLFVCPLGAKHVFTHEDGPRLGMEVQYVRNDEEVRRAHTPFLITNYERLREGNIDPRKHHIGAVSLDEGSILRSRDTKTWDVFQHLFAETRFRWVATATPSPNAFLELNRYADWLGIMDSGQALTRWFKRNPEKAGDLTLHPHHADDYWHWVASWALFLYAPSDLGYPDEGYALPKLNIHWHCVEVDHSEAWGETDNRGQHKMLRNGAASVQDAAREAKRTLPARLRKMQEIMDAAPERHWLLWHQLEAERKAIEQAVPGVVSVYGSQSADEKEERLLGFARGEFPTLATKPSIAGLGCNFQRHCHSSIFLGLDDNFEDLIQAVYRTYRFGQQQEVDIHLIYAESQEGIRERTEAKWKRHDELAETMRAIVQQHGLSHSALAGDLQRKIGVERQVVRGERFTAIHNDCVREVRRMPADSAGQD